MKSFSPLHILAGVVTLLVVAAVGVGLYLAGSPGFERERQFDTQRLNDLEQISHAVDTYFDGRGILPSDLARLTNEQYFYGSLVDPETAVAYEYRVTGATTYELCAMFVLSSDAINDPTLTGRRPAPYPVESAMKSENWWHEAGRSCFSFDVRLRIPGIACSLLKPCAAGQTCALLPDQTNAVCVPEGKECLAAGCLNNCVIAESYPVQVRCQEAAF